MIENQQRKVAESTSPVSEDPIALLKLVTQLLRSNEISNPMMNEVLRQCESLRIDIQAKLVSRAN